MVLLPVLVLLVAFVLFTRVYVVGLCYELVSICLCYPLSNKKILISCTLFRQGIVQNIDSCTMMEFKTAQMTTYVYTGIYSMLIVSGCYLDRSTGPDTSGSEAQTIVEQSGKIDPSVAKCHRRTLDGSPDHVGFSFFRIFKMIAQFSKYGFFGYLGKCCIDRKNEIPDSTFS